MVFAVGVAKVRARGDTEFRTDCFVRDDVIGVVLITKSWVLVVK